LLSHTTRRERERKEEEERMREKERGKRRTGRILFLA